MGSEDFIFKLGAADVGLVRTILAGQEALRGMGREFDKISRQGKQSRSAMDMDALATARHHHMNMSLLAQAAAKMKQNTTEATGGMAALGATVGRTAAQFLGVGSAIAAIGTAASLIRAEYERLVQLKLSANSEGAATAGAYWQAAAAAGGPGVINRNMGQFEQIIQALGQRNPQHGYEIGAAALSRRDVTRPESEALDVALAVAQATGKMNDPEMSRTYAGALESIQRRTPGKRDPRATMGKLLMINEISLPDKPQDIGRHQVPVIAQMMENYGDSFEQAAALTTVMSEEVVDEHGRRSSQATLNLATILDQAAATHPYLGMDDSFQSKWRGLNTFQRIALVRGNSEEGKMMRAHLLGAKSADPAIREMSLGMHGRLYEGALTGEKKTILAQQAIIDPNARMQTWSRVEAGYGELMKQAGDPSKAIAKFNEFAQVGTSPIEKFSGLRQKAEGTAGVAANNNWKRAAAGEVLKMVQDLGDLEGTGALQQKLRNIQAGLGTDGEIEQSMSQAAAIIGRAKMSVGAGGNRPGSAAFDRNFLDWMDKAHPDRAPARFLTVPVFPQGRLFRDPELRGEFIREEGTSEEAGRFKAFERGEKMLRGPDPGDSSSLRRSMDALTASIRGMQSTVVNVEINDRDSRVMRRMGDMPVGLESLSVG